MNWRMWRDVKRRRMARQYAEERLRYRALKRNTVLFKELQEVAAEELHNFPRDSCPSRIVDRCALTSRPRSTQVRWRLSRIMWRHFADYNKLSGVMRAKW